MFLHQFDFPILFEAAEWNDRPEIMLKSKDEKLGKFVLDKIRFYLLV